MFTGNSFPQFKSNRRDYVLIVSDILSRAVKGAKKTELMYKVGLNSAQLEKYMMWLVESELLELSNQETRPVYKTTVKGKAFLEAFGKLAELLDGFIIYERKFQETRL